MYSEQEFSEAIEVIYNFSSKLRAQVELIKGNAATCVVNMEDDVVAKSASNNLIEVMGRIEAILDNNVQKLLSNLEEERDRAARIAKYDEE